MLDIPHTFGGQLVTVAANSLISRVVSNVANNPLTASQHIFDGFGGDFFTPAHLDGFGNVAPGGAGFNMAAGISSYIGIDRAANDNAAWTDNAAAA